MATEATYTLTLESRDASGTLITNKDFLVTGVFKDVRAEGEQREYIGGYIDSGDRVQRAYWKVVFSPFYVLDAGVTQTTEDLDVLLEMLSAPQLWIIDCDLERFTRVYASAMPVQVAASSRQTQNDFANGNDKVTLELASVEWEA